MNGFQLLIAGEMAYYLKDYDKALEYYIKSIKKIMKDENVLTHAPSERRPGIPDDLPGETLAGAFQNFCGLFKDPKLNFTEATAPEAYKFLSSFRPSIQKEYPRFDTPRAQFLLKCLQICAALTLGVLAADKEDRATAAKRYKEAADLSETDPLFKSLTPAPGLETWIAKELSATGGNLRSLIAGDTLSADLLNVRGVEGGNLRRETVNVPYLRKDDRNEDTWILSDTFQMATDGCAECKTRGVKFQRCSRCKKVAYCGVNCQRAHWKAHKANCTAPSQ